MYSSFAGSFQLPDTNPSAILMTLWLHRAALYDERAARRSNDVSVHRSMLLTRQLVRGVYFIMFFVRHMRPSALLYAPVCCLATALRALSHSPHTSFSIWPGNTSIWLDKYASSTLQN